MVEYVLIDEHGEDDPKHVYLAETEVKAVRQFTEAIENLSKLFPHRRYASWKLKRLDTGEVVAPKAADEIQLPTAP